MTMTCYNGSAVMGRTIDCNIKVTEKKQEYVAFRKSCDGVEKIIKEPSLPKKIPDQQIGGYPRRYPHKKVMWCHSRRIVRNLILVKQQQKQMIGHKGKIR